jgi:two-component system chemotaxis response regulator CheY
VAHHALVVDDDAAECELLQRTLHGADIQAITLTDSSQALELARNQTFDAIFVDVNMPPPDGMEVARRIRASGSNQKTPLIMMTGSEDPSIVAKGFQAGINFFLYKPIVKNRLLNLVRVTQSVNRVEKRRFHRVPVNRKVELQLNQNIVAGTTIDLSLNGVLVRAPRTFPEGAALKMRMDLAPGKSALLLSGRVVRVPTPDSMGIYFEGIGLAESKQLQDFLVPLMLASENGAAAK